MNPVPSALLVDPEPWLSFSFVALKKRALRSRISHTMARGYPRLGAGTAYFTRN